MKIAIITNNGSGEESSEKRREILEKAFHELNVEVTIYSVTGEEIRHTTQQAIRTGFDIIVAAGGDGTINTVAEELVQTNIPLGILPLGTFNHFAKDLKIPLEIEDGAKLIVGGAVSTVDIGEVNSKIFLNNSSIGLYTMAVKLRDKELRQSRGGKKWKMFLATLKVFTHFPLLQIILKIGGKSEIKQTPFVFVGNNEYSFNLINGGTRMTLTGGKLSIYTPIYKGRLGLVRLFFLGLVNRLNKDHFDLHTVEDFELKTHKKNISVSMDGEIRLIQTPLCYKIRPQELLVILPP